MTTDQRDLPAPTRAPFAVAAQGARRAAALCIHGFTGTPFEVRPLADALAPLGVSSVGLLLPGHGTEPAELARTRWQDWQQAALAAWDALPSDVPRLIVGCSMGALLALRIAVLRHDVAAAVLLAPALCLFRDGELAARASSAGLWRLKPYATKEQAGGDIADPAARAANLTYPVIPLRALAELAALQRLVRAQLAHVATPLCVFHGAQDHTIPPAASDEIVAGVRSPTVEYHRLRDSFHVIGVDVDRARIAAMTTAFVARTLGWNG
ncbi:MAG: alpha/beta fold hydrolase [Deltaproteobacteria bacterium]|nr:alpha/beta fold hydrolase [Deltaproteobacteria bacterium]